METPIGTAFITVNETAEGEPFEVFVQVGKGGSDTMAVAEALGRLISLTLRLPSPMSPQRRPRRGDQPALPHRRRPSPWASARARCSRCPTRSRATLARAHRPGEAGLGGAAGRARSRPARIGDLCKECGQATFVYEEGCKKCLSCGFNEC